MRLSNETANICRQLAEMQSKKSWFNAAAKDVSICSLLQRLASAGELGSLPCSAQFLLSPSSMVQSEARKTVSQILKSVSPYDHLHINEAFLGAYDWYVSESWRKLVPSELAVVAGKNQEQGYCAVLGLASFHYNGYVRHEAVRLLSKITDGSELPFLLIRQNDWVVPIANDAQAAVTERVGHEYLPHLVKSLRLILHLSTFRRYDHREIVQRVVNIMLDEHHDDILRTAIASRDRQVRRTVVNLAFQNDGEHRRRVVLHGQNSNDPTIRLACFRRYSEVFDRDTLQLALNTAITDPFMPVRREGLLSKADAFPELSAGIWRSALLDPSAAIRELARFELARLGDTNLATVYRRAISESPQLLVAAQGLAETGDCSDIDDFQRLLNHPFPSRRCIGLQGLCRVRRESSLDGLYSALRDNHPSVSREARKQLGEFLHAVSGEKLLAIALDAQAEFCRRNAVALISELGKWKSVPWFLRAASSSSSETAEYAEEEIESWFIGSRCNRVFTRPSSSEACDIRMSLDQVESQISVRIVDLLRKELAKP